MSKTSVWVVEWYSAEPYEEYNGVFGVYSSKEKAQEMIEGMGVGPYGSVGETFALRSPEEFILDE